MFLRGVDGPLKEGDYVVCVKSEDERHYKPGEVFIVNHKEDLEAINPRWEQMNSRYGGDYAVWAVHHPSLVEIEDML